MQVLRMMTSYHFIVHSITLVNSTSPERAALDGAALVELCQVLSASRDRKGGVSFLRSLAHDYAHCPFTHMLLQHRPLPPTPAQSAPAGRLQLPACCVPGGQQTSSGSAQLPCAESGGH